MSRTTSLFLLFSAALFLSSFSADAFTMQQARTVEGLQSRTASKKILASILKMSEEGGDPQESAVQAKISADGTFYDDEVCVQTKQAC
jgi:hypothetical protein